MRSKSPGFCSGRRRKFLIWYSFFLTGSGVGIAHGGKVACLLVLPLHAGSCHTSHYSARYARSRARDELFLATATLLSAVLYCSARRLFTRTYELLLLRLLLLLCFVLLLVGSCGLLLHCCCLRCLVVPFHPMLLAIILPCVHLLLILPFRLSFPSCVLESTVGLLVLPLGLIILVFEVCCEFLSVVMLLSCTLSTFLPLSALIRRLPAVALWAVNLQVVREPPLGRRHAPPGILLACR